MMERDPEGFEELLEQMVRDGFGESFNQGGRVGMFAGGKLIGKGIMEAAKLAKRGMKPFGEKQTYKQKVIMKGVSDDQFDEIFEKQLARVPDEVVDEPTGRGLKFSLDEAEDILTGVKFGLLTQAQRTKLAKAMRDKVAKQIYDNPASGLNNDYLEYMDDAVGRMDDILEIEKLGGDLTPKPVKGAPEFIQTDFTQLNRLRDQGKDNIIPFKPKTKKAEGGRIGFKDGEVANPNLREGAVRQGMLPEEIEEEEKLLQAQLMDPSYNSVTGEYSIGGGLKIGPLQLEAMARGMEGIDPTMQYEGSLDLGNDLMLQGGYYDDAINTIPTGPFAGMGDVEDEIRLSLTKSFANGGTVPPQKGPMSEGMGTLYRRK